jgi:hypothetical protein
MPGLKRELAIYGLRELNERLRTAAIGKSSDAAIIALAEAYRRFVHERPGLYAATVHAPAPDDELHQQISRTIMQVVAAVLAPYQLSEIGLIHAIRSFRSITHGFASLELAGGFALEADRDESFHVLIQTYIVGLQAWQNY